MNAFFHMKIHSQVSFLEEENQWLRERLEVVTHENEVMRSERARESLQGKKRNQIGLTKVIHPLRSNSRLRSSKKQLGQSRDSTTDAQSKSARGNTGLS